MAEQEIYEKLAEHISKLCMGFPPRDDLIDILKECFTPREAGVALALPNKVIPMQTAGVDEMVGKVDLSREELIDTLDTLVEKGLLFTRKTESGERGYALLQVGFGFPQTFFWKGEDTPQGRKMAQMCAKYFNRKVTTEAFSSSGGTKPYRYIPVGKSIKPDKQTVLPYNTMEKVIEDAKRIGLAHCPCRMALSLSGRGGGCDHPKEVCMKFNDLADFVIERGLAREISKEEALEVIKKSEEAGLVHFVDNAEGEILHNCNCCGCACWNVGNIKRRKIPRDVIMATYFIRETDEDACIGCGACEEICPVDAVKVEEDIAVIDEEWCIGCGVCATVCPTDALHMKLRDDRTEALPAGTIKDLHEKILEEKGLK
ncbi:MAG: 4Fe-4S binding protein [Deltaproteobacteria bacterium]|nr:4Fe-4S binding protein [Deltaproteobacteria bacterium]